MTGSSHVGRTAREGRRTLFVALIAAAALVVPAAIAWACNPQAHLTLDRTTVSPGQTLTVSGEFFPRSTAISVSIENGASATVTTSANGAFRVALQAPGEAGSYAVIARKADGKFQSGLPARASFRVEQAQAPAPAAAEPQGGSQPSQSSQPSARFEEPEVLSSPSTAVQRERSSSRTERSTPRERTADRPAARRTEPAGGSAPATTVTDTGQVVFSESVSPATTGTDTAATGTTRAERGERRSSRSDRDAQPAPARPSESAANADVWSGFAPGRTPTLISSAAQAPDSGTGSQLGFGILLLAIGLVGLVTGLAGAELRRRRAIARH